MRAFCNFKLQMISSPTQGSQSIHQEESRNDSRDKTDSAIRFQFKLKNTTAWPRFSVRKSVFRPKPGKDTFKRQKQSSGKQVEMTFNLESNSKGEPANWQICHTPMKKSGLNKKIELETTSVKDTDRKPSGSIEPSTLILDLLGKKINFLQQKLDQQN